MNLILITPDEATHGLPGDDPRTRHIREVLRATPGTTLYVGIPNQLRGLATLRETTPRSIRWEIAWEPTPPTPLPLRLIVGLPRPQTARKILTECASLGFSQIHFFQPEKGDPAYAQSTLWSTNEARDLLHKGAEQAFTTLIPTLRIHPSLTHALAATADTTTTSAALAPASAPASAVFAIYGESSPPAPANTAKIFLDLYGDTAPLPHHLRNATHALLAIGPERGWSNTERDTLRNANFAAANIGDRVLRVETACIAAGAITLSHLQHH